MKYILIKILPLIAVYVMSIIMVPAGIERTVNAMLGVLTLIYIEINNHAKEDE